MSIADVRQFLKTKGLSDSFPYWRHGRAGKAVDNRLVTDAKFFSASERPIAFFKAKSDVNVDEAD